VFTSTLTSIVMSMGSTMVRRSNRVALPFVTQRQIGIFLAYGFGSVLAGMLDWSGVGLIVLDSARGGTLRPWMLRTRLEAGKERIMKLWQALRLVCTWQNQTCAPNRSSTVSVRRTGVTEYWIGDCRVSLP
jgi:hypothetical protein